MAPSRHIVMTVNAAWNIANFRLPLVKALLADGHRVTVLAPSDEAVPALTEIGCEFVHLLMDRKGLNPIGDIALMLRMLRHLRHLSPDVVLSFTIKNNVMGAMAAKSLNIPFLPNVTGLGTAFLSGRLMQAVARGLYRSAFRGLPAVFFQNQDDHDLFIELGLTRVDQARVLPGSGIDLGTFSPLPYPPERAGLRFLMVARLLRDKGVLEFVEAARIIKQERSDITFAMLGKVDDENRSSVGSDRVEKWQEDGLIEYLGTASDVRPLIAQAHCVVLPSYREGAPRTLIEAAALGRPAIASDVPGCNAVVEDGVTGYLCEVKNAEALAASMRRFADLEWQQKAAMAQNARQKIVREYGVDRVIAAYRDLVAYLQVER